MMVNNNKTFSRGKTIENVHGLLDVLDRDERIFFRNRLVHRNVIRNMTLITIELFLKVKSFAVAVRQKQ
jgi:hypothetical protein